MSLRTAVPRATGWRRPITDLMPEPLGRPTGALRRWAHPRPRTPTLLSTNRAQRGGAGPIIGPRRYHSVALFLPLFTEVPSTTSLDRCQALANRQNRTKWRQNYCCSGRKATKLGPQTGSCLPPIARSRPFLAALQYLTK